MTLLEPIAPETLRGLAVPRPRDRAARPARAAARGRRQRLRRSLNDRRIAENTLRIPHPYTLADARAFLAAANTSGGEIVFLITLRTATLIGACGIGTRDGEQPEIGYWLGVPFWGKGYATEAARALIDHAFGDLGYERAASAAHGSATRPRAGCWRNAASSGPASASTASARSARRRRSIASGSTAVSGPPSRAGAKALWPIE